MDRERWVTSSGSTSARHAPWPPSRGPGGRRGGRRPRRPGATAGRRVRPAPRRRRQPGRRRRGRAVGRRPARPGRRGLPGPDRRRRPDAAGRRAVGAGGADGVAGALGRRPGRRARGRRGRRGRRGPPGVLGRRAHRAAGRAVAEQDLDVTFLSTARAAEWHSGAAEDDAAQVASAAAGGERSPCLPATSRRSGPTTSPPAWPGSPSSRACRRSLRAAPTRTTARRPRFPRRARTTRAPGRTAARRASSAAPRRPGPTRRASVGSTTRAHTRRTNVASKGPGHVGRGRTGTGRRLRHRPAREAVDRRRHRGAVGRRRPVHSARRLQRHVRCHEHRRPPVGIHPAVRTAALRDGQPGDGTGHRDRRAG